MMKNDRGTRVACATGLLIVCCALTGRAEVVTWTVNQAISDNNAMGLQNTQTLSGYTDVIGSLEVRLTLTGDPLAYNGDFFVSLQCGNGGYAVLLNRVGRTGTDPLGYSQNGFDLTFRLFASDVHLYQAFSPSYDTEGRLTGTWGADGRNVDPDSVLDVDLRTADLNRFFGIDPNGDWTLFVADMNGNGTATLDSWGLDITPIPEPGTLGLLVLGALALRRRRK